MCELNREQLRIVSSIGLSSGGINGRMYTVKDLLARADFANFRFSRFNKAIGRVVGKAELVVLEGYEGFSFSIGVNLVMHMELLAMAKVL